MHTHAPAWSFVPLLSIVQTVAPFTYPRTHTHILFSPLHIRVVSLSRQQSQHVQVGCIGTRQ